MIGDENKFDGDKTRLDLVEPSLIEAIGRVRTYGVKKYHEEQSWRKVEKKRYIAAAMRHFEAYRAGETTDSESGMPHLWHCACNLMFLIELDNKERKNERGGNMKAWLVNEKDETVSAVVFAETRGKAKSLALCTSSCEDANFCDIEVSRVPEMDKYYAEGKTEMDWSDPKDRIALVKECGFYCEEPIAERCKSCPAKEFCDEDISTKEAL